MNTTPIRQPDFRPISAAQIILAALVFLLLAGFLFLAAVQWLVATGLLAIYP